MAKKSNQSTFYNRNSKNNKCPIAPFNMNLLSYRNITDILIKTYSAVPI